MCGQADPRCARADRTGQPERRPDARPLLRATASGRIVVPINFRLTRDEIAYIVEHSQASLLLVDPDYDEALADVPAPRRLVLGPESDEALLRYGAEPRPWEEIDENAYKCPTSVDAVDALPRTATGKVQKYQVRAPHWAGRDRQVA